MSVSTYANFDLLITRAGERYRAFVIDAPAGEASVLFDLPFAPDELAGLGSLARNARRHLGAADAPGPAASLVDLGSRLFEAVFRDKVQTLLATSLSSVTQDGAGLRVRLRFEEDAADLATLPWEALYDPIQGHFIGLGEQSLILRYLSLPRSRSALLVEPPLRVLALFSSPTGLAPLDMEREWQAIQNALAGLTADGKFVLERLQTPSLSALQDRLLGEPVHILHFVGHGVFDESSHAGSLALEDARGSPHLVRGEQLATLLRNHPAMRLAYLNACEGALASGRSVFTGVAQTLVQQGVPAAVAMQAEITDTGAIELARTFYTALAAGRPVDAALTQARVALSAAGSQEWAIPVLFSRSPDNRLFDIREMLPTPDCPYPGMTPFTEAQQAFFFGRDREIGEAVERLRQHPFLTVVGPSGSGKSSLIYAGVIPALRRSKRFGPGEWSAQIMRPGQHPLAALGERLGCSPETLSSVTFSERTLLFVDQFEEAFTLAEAGEAQAFLKALQELIGRPDLFILLTARADFYPDLMASSLWQPIRANRLELTPLGDDELWAAIVEPAAHVGVTVDEALAVQLIADAAGESGVLPLVQETLVLLWDRVNRRRLDLAAYRQMAEGTRSGIQVAIDRRASLVYENLVDAAQPIARRIFLRLIQFGEGRADTRRQQTVAELRANGDDSGLFDRTLGRLTESRLLTASGDAEGTARRIDIAHEALIAGWPRLQGWLRSRKEAEQARRRLEDKVKEWVRLGRGEGGLLDKAELAEADTWLQTPASVDLGASNDLMEFVRTSKENLYPGWHRLGFLMLLVGIISVVTIVVSIYVSLQLANISPTSWYAIRVFLGLIAIATVIIIWQIARQDRRFLPRLTHLIAGRMAFQTGVAVLFVIAGSIGFSFGLQPLRLANQCKAYGYGTSSYNFEAAVINDDVDPAKAELFAWVLESTSKGLLTVHRATNADEIPITCENFLRFRIRLGRHSETATTETEVVYSAQLTDIQTKATTTYLYAGPEDKCGLILNVANQVAASLNFRKKEEVENTDPAVAADSCAAYLTYQKGISLQQSRRFAEAKQEFENALASFSGYERDPSFLLEYAMSCYTANDLDCAKQSYETLISLTPDKTIAYQNLSVVLRRLGEYTAADAVLTQVEAKMMTIADEAEHQYQEYLLRKNRGFLAFDGGQYEAAELLLLEALESEQVTKGRQSFQEEIMYYLASISEKLRTPEEACTRWGHYMDTVSNRLIGEQERRQDAQNHIRSHDCK